MVSVIALTLITGGQSPALQTPTPPALLREFRGVWVATVDNIDWPSKRDLTTAEQQAELIKILDTCQSMNLNAVVFQIRPSADALYESKLEPWSAYLTGTQGKAPNPKWDPLAFAVTEAHRRGLELHCWFNPYRATHPAQKSENAATHISKTNPQVVRQYGGYDWMDPSEPFVQKRSLDVMLDVVKRYDIDGVHIDDYFYPYPVTDAQKQKVPFPDAAQYAAYQKRGGKLAINDWRRKNVDDFIQNLYTGIKKTKKWVKFGISPFGIYRPGTPPTIKAGIDQYDELYADAKKWLEEGWCDYYTPQLYWPIAQTPQSYPVLYDWWLSVNAKKRHLWPGNYTGRTDPNGGNWKPKEVIDQIEITRKGSAGSGNVHFSMKAFSRDYNGITTALKRGPYAAPAIVPASEWLGDEQPAKPKADLKVIDGNLHVMIKEQKDARFFAVAFAVPNPNGGFVWGKWVTSSDRDFVLPIVDAQRTSHVAIVPLSKTMVAGAANVMPIKGF